MHSLAWLPRTPCRAVVVQCEVHGALDVFGVCEENGSLADRKVREARCSLLLSRPAVNGVEQDFVGVEDILVEETRSIVARRSNAVVSTLA